MTHLRKNGMRITQYVLSIFLMFFCIILLFSTAVWAFADDEEFPWILFYPAITGVKRVVPTDSLWHLIASSPDSSGAPAIWAASGDNAFAGGSNGIIYHFDGKRWTPMEKFTSDSIRYIWGFNNNDFYAVTDPTIYDNSNIYHYNGNSWELMKGSPVGWSIWGTGPTDLFVAANGEVYHYDGSTWTTMIIPESAKAVTLWEIWGAAGDDVFVVGNKGIILHYNGTEWSTMNSNTIGNIWEVWGTASNNVYAITLNTVLHYDGKGWSEFSINIDYPYDDLRSIWGNAADNIYISSYHTLMSYNGKEWQQVAAVGASSIWGSSGKVFLAGDEVGIYESNSYKRHYFVASERIITVSGSASNNVLLGGMWTYGLLYDGREWQRLYPTYNQHPNFHFYFAWVIDKNNIIAGDDDEIKYYDGTDWWSHRILNYDSFIDNSQDAWAQTSSEGFVVARAGRVYKFNNEEYWLTEMDTPTSVDLHGVWGTTANNVYAVGNGGTILHYNGSVWVEINNPATQDLNAVWGNDSQDIYAVGKSGTIIHYDGNSWNIMAQGQFTMLFRDVWGFSPDNIYAAGSDGLVHYDGNRWSILNTGYNLDLKAVWGSDPGNIYLVDQQGNVYQYSK